MANEKQTDNVSNDELERQFARLSMTVEKSHREQFKRRDKSVPPENPFLKRRATVKELTEGIDKLQNLCYETQGKLELESQFAKLETTPSDERASNEGLNTTTGDTEDPLQETQKNVEYSGRFANFQKPKPETGKRKDIRLEALRIVLLRGY
ncbi:hypothetical protein PG994_003465 [Apiospora phragmitis]|uniref:Uncharacterized protein n=1 Tax=Apiospora phragmitis TaxID=2905665 RepID=A0ABR1VY97_9PEZI